MLSDRIWIVVVNEEASRFLLQPKRGSPLVEFVDYADSHDFLLHDDEQPSDLCRSGGRTIYKPRVRKNEEQLRVFLDRVARQIDEAQNKYPADGVAICAPANVLNLLRDAMSPASRKLLMHESTQDLVRKPIDAIAQLFDERRAVSS